MRLCSRTSEARGQEVPHPQAIIRSGDAGTEPDALDLPQLIPLDPLTDLALIHAAHGPSWRDPSRPRSARAKAEAALRIAICPGMIKETCALIRCYPIPVLQARGHRHLLPWIRHGRPPAHQISNGASDKRGPCGCWRRWKRKWRFTLGTALSGNDLNMIGIRGKAAGDTLKLLLDHVLDHPEDNDKKTLMRLAEQHISGSD
ncbi:MAG: hypothetical protein ACLTCB_01950 [Merdibacter sp.]